MKEESDHPTIDDHQPWSWRMYRRALLGWCAVSVVLMAGVLCAEWSSAPRRAAREFELLGGRIVWKADGPAMLGMACVTSVTFERQELDAEAFRRIVDLIRSCPELRRLEFCKTPLEATKLADLFEARPDITVSHDCPSI